jgi:hypothetical protein
VGESIKLSSNVAPNPPWHYENRYATSIPSKAEQHAGPPQPSLLPPYFADHALQDIKSQIAVRNENESNRYYTTRHLLEALQQMDDRLLDYPLVLVHGKRLQKPILIQGLLPVPTPVDQRTVESKPASLLTLGELTDLNSTEVPPNST